MAGGKIDMTKERSSLNCMNRVYEYNLLFLKRKCLADKRGKKKQKMARLVQAKVKGESSNYSSQP